MRLVPQQGRRLVMTPLLQQAIQLLQLSTLEFEQVLRKERVGATGRLDIRRLPHHPLSSTAGRSKDPRAPRTLSANIPRPSSQSEPGPGMARPDGAWTKATKISN